MFEKQISDLLATSLRRFVRNLNEEQLQVSVWSGEVVLRDLELQDDILEQLSLLLLPKPSTESMANDSDNQPSSYSESESSARSLLLPFTVVRGVIHELVIHLPWSSLDSEPVEVEVHGVEIEFGPLRCRRYDPEEERARVELMKHECLKKFERSHRKTSEGSSSRADLPQASRDRGATPTLTRTPDAGSSRSSTPPKEVVHSPSRLSPSSPSGFLSSLSPMSYFEGLVDTIVRNAQFLLRHVSIVFRMDYAGLHPSLAKSVLWWLTEVRITTVNDLCRGAFFADAGGNMSKHIAVKGLEVSVFSELDNEKGCAASDLSGPCMEASSSSQSSGEGIVDEHAADFRKQWRFRQRLASIDCCTFQCRLSRPHSLRVSCTSDMKLEASFGSILVVEQLLEQLTHSLQYAKYRKHLHLLLPSTTTEMHNIHRRRWIFAINCVLDEVRSRQANLLGGGLGDRIAAFCNIRRSYCLLWKRQSQAHWYPPLDPQENLEVVRLEQMLTVDQIVFLRCFARAEVQTEAAQYEQQRQWIADAAARRGASQVKASKWWGWGSKSRVEKPPTDVATPSSSGRLSAAASTSGFANVLNKEWSSAQQFLKDRVAPLMPGNSTARRGSTSGQPAFLSSSSMLSCPGLRLTFYPTYWGRTAPTYAPPLQQLQQHLVVSLGQLDMSHNGAATMMAHTTRIIVNSVSAELCGPVRMPLLQSRASERQDWLNMDITKAGRHVAIHMSLVVAVIRPTHELRWWIDGIATFGRLWTTHRALRRSSMDPSPALGTSNSADSMPVSTLGRSSLEIEVRVNGAHVVVPLTSDDVEMDEVLCEESAASVPIPVAPSACVAQQQHSHADPSPPLDDNRSSEGEEVWRGDATSPITPGAPVVPHNEGQRQDSVVNSFGEDEVQVVAPLQPISLKKVFVKGASCLIFSTPIVDASALWTPVNYGSMWELQCEAQVGDGEGIATTLYCHTPVLNAEVLLASRRDILTFSHFIVAVEDRLVGLDVYGAAEVVVDPLTVGLLSHHFVKPPSPFADSSVHEEIYALLQKQKQDRPHDTSCCWNMMADEGTLSVGEGHSASCYSIRPGCQREAATLMHEWCSAIFAADLPRNAEATEVQATESKGWRFLAAVGLLRVAVRDRNSDLVAELEVVPSPGETLPSDSPFRSPLFTGQYYPITMELGIVDGRLRRWILSCAEVSIVSRSGRPMLVCDSMNVRHDVGDAVRCAIGQLRLFLRPEVGASCQVVVACMNSLQSRRTTSEPQQSSTDMPAFRLDAEAITAYAPIQGDYDYDSRTVVAALKSLHINLTKACRSVHVDGCVDYVHCLERECAEVVVHPMIGAVGSLSSTPERSMAVSMSWAASSEKNGGPVLQVKAEGSALYNYEPFLHLLPRLGTHPAYVALHELNTAAQLDVMGHFCSMHEPILPQPEIHPVVSKHTSTLMWSVHAHDVEIHIPRGMEPYSPCVSRHFRISNVVATSRLAAYGSSTRSGVSVKVSGVKTLCENGQRYPLCDEVTAHYVVGARLNPAQDYSLVSVQDEPLSTALLVQAHNLHPCDVLDVLWVGSFLAARSGTTTTTAGGGVKEERREKPASPFFFFFSLRQERLVCDPELAPRVFLHVKEDAVLYGEIGASRDGRHAVSAPLQFVSLGGFELTDMSCMDRMPSLVKVGKFQLSARDKAAKIGGPQLKCVVENVEVFLNHLDIWLSTLQHIRDDLPQFDQVPLPGVTTHALGGPYERRAPMLPSEDIAPDSEDNVLEEWAMSPSMQNVVANLLLVGLKEEMVTLEVSVVNAAIVCYHEGTPDYGLRMDIEHFGLHLVSNGQEADKARWEYVLTVDSPLNMAGVHPNGRLPLLEWVTPKQDYFVRVAGNEANCCVDVHGPRLILQAELWQHLEKLGEKYERFPLLTSTYPEYDESDSADGDGMPPSPELGHLGGPHNPLKSHFGFMLYIRDGTVSLPYSSLSAAVRDQVSCSSEANLSSVPLITMGRLTIDKSQPGKTTFVRGQRLVVLGTAVHPVHLHDNFFELRSGDASQRHLDTRCSKKAQRIVLSLEEIKTIFTFTKVLRDALPERRPQWPATGRVSIPQPNLCTYLQISPLEVILVEQTPVRDAAGEAVVAPDGYLLNLSFQLALVGESYPRSNDVLVNVQQLKLAGPNNTTILAPQNWTRSTTLCFSSNKMGSQVSVDVRLDVCLSTAVIGACARLHQAIIPVLASDSVKWEEHAPSDKSLSSRPQHMKVLVTLDHLQVHVGGSATVKFNSVQCAQPTSVSVTFTPGDEAPVIGFEGNVCVLRQQGDSDTILNYNRVYSESVQHYLAVLVVSATVIPKKSAEVLVRACFLDDADDRLLPDLMREVSLLQTELGASGILLGGAERTRREGRSSMSWSVRVENAFAVFHSLMGPTRAHGFIHVHFPCTTWKSEGTDQQEEVSISSINGSISYLTVGPSNMMAWHRRGGYTSNSHTRPYVEPIWKRGSYVSRHVLASNLKVDISAHVNGGSKCRETMVTVDPIMCFLPTGTTLLHCSEAVVRLVRQLRACVDLHGHDGAACRGDALETSLGHNGLLLVNLRRPIGSQLPTLTEVPSSKSSLSESDEDPSSRLTFRLPWISVSIVDEESAITGVRDTGCGDGDEGDDEAPHQDVPTREVLSFHVNGQGEVDDSDDDDVPSHRVHLSMECRGISCDVLSKLHSRVVLAQIDSVSSTVDHALQQRCFLSSSAPADTSALPSQSAMFVRLEQLRSESFSTASHDIQTTRSTLVGRAHNCEVTVSPTLWRFLHEHVLSGIATSLRTAHLHFHSTPVPIATTASAASVAQSQNVTLCVSSDIRLTDTIVLGGPHGPRLHFVKDARRSNPGNTIKVSSADGAALVMSVVQLPNGELQCPVEVDDGMTVVLEGTEVVLRGLPATQVSLRNFVALGKRSIFVVPDSCLVSGEEPSVAAKYPAVPRASPLVRAVHSVHDVDLVANVHVRIWSHRQTLCFGTEANLSYHVERTRTGNLLSSVEDERGECILRRCTMESESGSIIAAPLDISTTIQLHKLSQGGINDVLTSIRLLFPAMHVKCTMGHMLLFMDSIRQFLLALKSLSPNHGGADRDSMAHQRRNKFRRFSPDAIRHTTGNERVPLVEVGVTAPELELTITSDFFTPVLSATLMEVSVNANGSRDGQSMSLLGTAQLTVCDFPPLESSRNLLQVTPEVAYQFTRFPTGCETCKCTVGCSNVHVTLPLVAALRSLHYQWTDGRVGCYAFHNSLGMPLLVVAPYGASEKHGGTVPYCCLPPSSTVEADLFQFSQTKFRIIAGDESILHSPDTLASLHTLGTEVDLCQLAEGCTFRFTMHRHPRGVLDAVLRMDEAKRYIHVTTSVHLHNELETVSVVFPGQLTTLTGGSSCYATMEALQQPVSLTVGEYQSSLDVPLITWGSLINSILLLDAVDGLEAGDAASTREDVLCRLGVHFVNAQTVALQVKMRVAPTEDAPYSSDHAAFVNVLVEKRPATVSPREGGHHLLPCYEVDVRVRAAIRINNCTSDRISVKIFTTNTSKGGDRDQEVKETSLAGKGHLHWFFEGTTPHRPHLSFAFLGNQGEEVTGNGNNLHYTNPVDVSFDGRRVVSMVARTGGAVALILEHADFCTINIKCMAVIQNGLPASVCLHATPTSIFASGATARVRDGEETSVYVPFNPKLAPSKHLDMMTAVCVAVGDEGATQSKSFIANVPTLSATLASEHKNSIAVFAATACPAHASGSVPHVSLQPVWGVHNAHPHLSLEIRAVGKEMDTLSVAPGARQDLFDFGLSSGTPLPHLQFRFGNHVEHTSPIYQWSPPICATALFDSRSPMGIKHMVDSTHTLHKMSAPPRQSGEATFSNLRVPTHRDAACFDECFSVLQLTPFVAGHRHTVSVALAQHSPCVLENRTRFDLQWSFTGAASDYHQMSGIDDRATIWAYLIPPHTDCFSCRSLVADGSPTLQLTLLNQPRLTSTTVDLVAAVAGKDAVKLGSQAFVLVTEDASTGRYFITITEDRSLESALLFEQRYVGHFEVFLRDIAVHTAVPFVRPSTTHLSQVPLLSFLDDATEGSSMYLKGIRRTSSDEKKVDALKQKDLDLVMVHVVGFYASGSWDREQLLASVEVGSLDVVDCTAPRPVYPIILHVGEAETSDRPREAGVSLAVHMLWPKRLAGGNMSRSSTTSNTDRPAEEVTPYAALQIEHLRLRSKPMVLSLHDSFLYVAKMAYQCIAEFQASFRDSLDANREHTTHKMMLDAMIKQLEVSEMSVEFTLTRRADRRFNPYESLPTAVAIPSIERAPIKIGATVARDLHQRSPSLVGVFADTFWLLYRRRLVLQLVKVVGSLELLGNPLALLDSWERGVKSLFHEVAVKQPLTGARELIRETASSSLHSVSLLSKFSSRTIAALSLDGDWVEQQENRHFVQQMAQRRSFFGDVGQGLLGGVEGAVGRTVKGVTRSGVSGLVTGAAFGAVSLVSRPVVSVLQGVGGATEFYSQKLRESSSCGSESSLEMYQHASRNFTTILTTLDEGSDQVANAQRELWATVRAQSLCVNKAAYKVVLDMIAKEQLIGSDASRRIVDTIGAYSLAVFADFYTFLDACTPEELQRWLHVALDAHFARQMQRERLQQCRSSSNLAGGRSASYASVDKREESMASVVTDASTNGDDLREKDGASAEDSLQRARQIKATLGVMTLARYVSADIFVRTCTVDEILAHVPPENLRNCFAVVMMRCGTEMLKSLIGDSSAAV